MWTKCKKKRKPSKKKKSLMKKRRKKKKNPAISQLTECKKTEENIFK